MPCLGRERLAVGGQSGRVKHPGRPDAVADRAEAGDRVVRQWIAVHVGARLGRHRGGERQDGNETPDHVVNLQRGSSFGKSISITCPSSVTFDPQRRLDRVVLVLQRVHVPLVELMNRHHVPARLDLGYSIAPGRPVALGQNRVVIRFPVLGDEDHQEMSFLARPFERLAVAGDCPADVGLPDPRTNPRRRRQKRKP